MKQLEILFDRQTLVDRPPSIVYPTTPEMNFRLRGLNPRYDSSLRFLFDANPYGLYKFNTEGGKEKKKKKERRREGKKKRFNPEIHCSRWNATAADTCRERNMNLRSFAMLLPCGISLFSGVEFVCCPKHLKGT